MNHVNEVQRQLIAFLKTSFPAFTTVALTTDVDFSTGGPAVAEQSLPCLYLAGPATERNAMFTSQVPPRRALPPATLGGPDRFRRFSVEEAYDLTYMVVLLAKTQLEMGELFPAVQAFFMNGKTVSALARPDDLASPLLQYEVDLVQKFKAGRMVNLSNLKEMSGSLVVRGVLFADGSYEHDGAIAQTINLDTEPFEP